MQKSNKELYFVAVKVFLEKDKLKMEIFPGKVKEKVSGFTQKAKTYER